MCRKTYQRHVDSSFYNTSAYLRIVRLTTDNREWKTVFFKKHGEEMLEILRKRVEKILN